jgi:hypothetical protein
MPKQKWEFIFGVNPTKTIMMAIDISAGYFT